MIAPLRRRHRWLTGLLAVVVPVVFALALASRPAVPVSESLPEALAPATQASGGVVGSDLAFEALPMTARVTRDGANFRIQVVPTEALAKPEVLAYWTPAGSALDRLPTDAWLLGAVGGLRPQAFTVPEAVQGREGQLVLYSLGHQEVLGAVALPAIGSLPDEPMTEASATPTRPATPAGETPAGSVSRGGVS